MKTFYYASHVEYGKFPLQWQVSYTEALHKGWKHNTRKWRTDWKIIQFRYTLFHNRLEQLH